jgi:hypothetical protein
MEKAVGVYPPRSQSAWLRWARLGVAAEVVAGEVFFVK